jgi:hypothetical protein
MGDGVSVDLSALTTFAHNAGRLADEAQSDTKSLVQDSTNNARDALTGSMHSMATTGSSVYNKPGFANFHESTAFARYHIVVAMSAAQFLNDVFMGTASLGAGAEFCAVNYANTDDFNARTLGNIQSSLKQGGLAGQDFVMSGGSVNLNGNQVNGAFAPKDGDGLFTTSTGTPPQDPNTVGNKGQPGSRGQARNPQEGDTKDPDPYADFQKAIDQQQKEIDKGKVPDQPGHTQAPDSTDMPFPDGTPAQYRTGGGGVSV